MSEEIKELIERIEKLEKGLKGTGENQIDLLKEVRIDVPVAGGLDDGSNQRVSLKAVVLSIMDHLGIKPTFKREIEFMMEQPKDQTNEIMQSIKSLREEVRAANGVWDTEGMPGK